MDSHLKNGPHINKICGQLFGILKHIQKLRSHLDEDTAKTVVQALILSKLDYCNSALVGSASYQLDKLQRVQNMACRVVSNLGKYDHVSSEMKRFHWLKIREHITYKIAILVFKCRCGNAPGYLQDLIKTRQSCRRLQPSSMTSIVPRFCKNELPKSSSFASIGPHIWNNLPVSVRTQVTVDSFKRALKTHLFNISYGQAVIP